MNPFWSQIARELSPYVPGEQPRVADLVKLRITVGTKDDARRLVAAAADILGDE